MTDDMISRRAAIDALMAILDKPKHAEFLYTDEICRALNELLSAEPQWIPCCERLPDTWDERYLVSLAWGGIGVMEYKSTGFHNYGSFSPVPIETITAWMPLPEPYQAERRQE